jgi:thioredoxin 1
VGNLPLKEGEPFMEANTRLLTVDEASFESRVLHGERPALVDFSAEWCGPCRAIAPTIEGLAEDYADRVTVAKVDIDANPGLAARYGVRSVPTVMLFDAGDVRRVYVGARPAQEYRDGVESLVR